MAFPWAILIEVAKQATKKKHPGTSAALGALGGAVGGKESAGDSGIADQPTLEQLGAAGPNVAGGPLATREMTGPIAMHAVPDQPGTFAPASQQFPAATARPYSTLAQAPMSNATSSPFDPTQSRILAQQSYDTSQQALSLNPTSPPHPAQTYPKWLTNPIAQAFVGRYAPSLVQNALAAQQQEAVAQQGDLGLQAIGEQRTLQDIEQQQAGYNRGLSQEHQLGSIIIQAGKIMQEGIAAGKAPSEISAALAPLLSASAQVRPSPEGVAQLARFPGQQREQQEQEQLYPLQRRGAELSVEKGEADVRAIPGEERRATLQEQLMRMQLDAGNDTEPKRTREAYDAALVQAGRYHAFGGSLTDSFELAGLSKDPILAKFAAKTDAISDALKKKKSAIEGVKTVQEFFEWYNKNEPELLKRFHEKGVSDMLGIIQQTITQDVSPEVANQFQAILEAAQSSTAPMSTQPQSESIANPRRRFAVQ
jgi:hypothetical protein